MSFDNVIIFNAIRTFKLSKLGENEIEILYSSDTARKEFQIVEKDFINHLKHKINNFKIQISYKQDPTQRQEILTKRKIFDKLVEVNPVLKDLEDLMKFDFS